VAAEFGKVRLELGTKIIVLDVMDGTRISGAVFDTHPSALGSKM
jgi:hypothetical protein